MDKNVLIDSIEKTVWVMKYNPEKFKAQMEEVNSTLESIEKLKIGNNMEKYLIENCHTAFKSHL
ncbi:hypothetical protein [Aeromonas salmonicida]|uniref:hypothetical protein n=1 Tax=Aeromonas salmonicida TaxID=645 RepID=UPI0038BC59C1